MQIAKTIEEIRMIISEAGSLGKKIGFVPTMGALHAGHISLIKTAKLRTEFVIVSIFVNPTQFGPGEDIDKYPRPFESDIEICKANGADAVFAPSAKEMYPQQNLTWINVEKLSELLCGKTRPGHFRGVATVCAKLFNIIQPDVAFFGQKDAQQVIIIQRMISDLNLPMRIVVCPIVREEDGLAMSSRNKYLNSSQRKDSPLLYAALQEAEFFIKAGERKCDFIKEQMKKILNISSQIEIDYISIVDAQTLDELDEVKGKVLIALAVKLGSARLIDNIVLDVK